MSDVGIRADGLHIVDQLILERAPHLLADPVACRAFANFLLRPLRYAEAREMADRVRGLSGGAILDLLSAELALRVKDTGRTLLPAHGPAIIVANHPTGLADGIAVWDSIRRRRQDVHFLVNGDALRVAPGLADVMIPIELNRQKCTRAASRLVLRQIKDAIGRGRVIVVFPSGRLAHLSWRGLRERTWLPSVLSIARRHALPIVPLHIRAANSPAFYLLSQLGRELRDVTLFRELLNKRGRTFRLSYGAPVAVASLPDDPRRAMAALQHQVENLLPLAAAGRSWERGRWGLRSPALG